MKKKISSVILTLSMLISLLVPMTTAQAALGINHEFEVSLMAALGIVPGYPESYTASAPVSQSEFVQYAYASVDIEIGNYEDVVKSYNWQSGSTQITVSQASQVIFDAIGYTPLLNRIGIDPYEYAKQKGILKGVANGSAESGVTTESAVMIIYNALQLKTLENNNIEYEFGSETIMEDKLNIYKETGIVTANSVTGLSGYGSTSSSTVKIGDSTYNTGRTKAQSLLGCYVKFYYQDNKDTGEYVLKWIEIEESKTTRAIVYGCDINSIHDNVINYTNERGSDKNIRVAANADIIYNGQLTNNLSFDVMSSLTSETTLISNDGSSEYNVVIIKNYSYYLVDSFTSSSLMVNDFAAKTTLDLDEGNYSSLHIYKDGVEAGVSEIAAGQVLAVAMSDDGSVAEVNIVTGSVTGEITQYSLDTVKIGDTLYDISPAYAGDQLKNGRNGTFYFDKLGKIVRCTTLKGQSSKYGYLMKFFSNSDGEGDYVARVLTAEGTVVEFNVKDTISYNGSKKSSRDVYYLIDAGNNCEQLVTYSVNAENVITKIDTADEKYIGIDEDEIDKFTIHFKGAGRYRRTNMTFNSKYMIDDSTPIFFIPYSGEKEDYTVKNASYLTNNHTYDISVYDIDNYMYPSAVVLRENIIEPENLRTKRSFIITDVEEAVKADGDIGVQLTGYQQGSKVSYFLSNENLYDNRGNVLVSTLRAGDVVQLGINVKNEINAVQLLFRANNEKVTIANGTSTPNKYWEGGSVTFPDLWVSFGEVVDRNNISILVDADADDTVITKEPHKIGNAAVYIYEGKDITVSNKNEISVGDQVYVHEYQGNVQEILIIR